MKRSKIITAFLLCACLLVGVGYAALADVMDVTGTTTYNQDTALDSLVYFKDPGKSNDDNNIQLIDGNHDKVSFNITSLAQINGKTYFWVKIVNDSTETVTINFKEYSANTHGQTYYQMYYYMGGDIEGEITTSDYSAVSSKDSSFIALKKQGEVYDPSDQGQHTSLQIAGNTFEYLCIKVVLTGELDQETDKFIMPGNTTISATFNFEIEATTDD